MRIYGVLHGLYQLAIAVWLGSGVMIGIAAKMIFDVSRKLDAGIGHVDYQGAGYGDAVMTDVLAGQIVGGVILASTIPALICMLYVVFFLALEATTFRKFLDSGVSRWVRLVFLAGAMGVFVYGAGAVQPRAFELSGSRYEAGISVIEREERVKSFDEVHVLSTNLMKVQILLLVGVFFTRAHRGAGAVRGVAVSG